MLCHMPIPTGQLPFEDAPREWNERLDEADFAAARAPFDLHIVANAEAWVPLRASTLVSVARSG